MKTLRLFSLLALLVLLAACGGSTPPAPTPLDPTPEPGPNDVVISDIAKIVDAATRDALVGFDVNAGTLRFDQTTPLLDDLASGDVLVSEPNNAAPAGYLRKVLSTRQENGQFIVETGEASLEEVVVQGSLDVSEVLSSSELESFEPALEGIELNYLDADSLATQANFGFELEFSQVLYDADNNQQTTNDQLVLDGEFEFTPKIYADLEFKNLKLQALELGMGFDEAAALRLSGELALSVERKIKVGQFNFKPKVFFIGPVPVVLVPRVDIVIGVNGEIGAEFTFEVSQRLDLKLAGAWQRGQGWQDVSSVERNLSWEKPTYALSLTARAYAGIDADILLYGIAGPYLYGYAFSELNVEVPRDPLWIAYAGLEAGLGFKVNLIGYTLGDWNTPVLEGKVEFARAANQDPSITITAPTLTDVGLGETVVFQASASDPEDGTCGDLDSTCTITWTSNQDGTIGQGSFTEASFDTAGQRMITATVTDSAGETRSDSIMINVTNTPTLVMILAPTASTTIYAGENFNLVGNSEDPDNSFQRLADSDVRWRIRRVGGNVALFNKTGHNQVTNLPAGNYIVSFIALDSGLASQASLEIEVVELEQDQTPPVATIIQPTGNEILGYNNEPVMLNLQGSASDAEDGELGGEAFRWTIIDEDGVETVLCEGSKTEGLGGLVSLKSCKDVTVAFTPELNDPQGNYVIRLEVTDSSGLTSSDEVEIGINFAIG